MRKKTIIFFGILIVVITLSFGVITAGCAPKEKAKLSIITFKGYAEDEWVKPFEEKYNCTVEVTYIGTIDECFGKVSAAPDQYNLVSIDSGRAQLYYSAGLIKDIDISKLKNYNKLGDYFKNSTQTEMEKGKKFHIPIVWGSLNFLVNMETAGEDIKPYLKDASNGTQTLSSSVIKDPKFANRVAIMDDTSNVLAVAAISLGLKEPYNLNSEDGWVKVTDELNKWIKNFRTFTSGMDSEVQAITSGDVDLVFGGNDAIDALTMTDQGVMDKYKFFLPTEGVVVWIDGFALTKNTTGATLDLAQKYIDYIISDEGQQKLAKLIGFGPTNLAGASGLSDVTRKETPWYAEGLDKVPVPVFIMSADEDPGKRVKIWTDIKASIGK